MNGAITHEILLEMLRDGEVLPNVDVEAEVELTGQEKAQNMMVNMLPDVASANGAAGAAAASEEQQSEQPSEIRSLVEERLRRMAGASTTSDDDDET